MRTDKVSLRGKLMRDMMKNMMDSAMGHRIQTGELRKNPVEPAWICPAEYEYEIIEMEKFSMEYLRPAQVCTGRVILQLHGGGYIGPMKNIYRDFAVYYSKRSMGGDVLTIDYRVAPEYPYPAALMDAVEAYRWLLEEKQYAPEKIVVAGDSAGGGLTLALAMYLRDHHMPMPAGLVLMSPWTDLTCSGESHETNFNRDPQFGGTTDNLLHNSVYIGEADPSDPYLSPAFGHFEKMPPVLIQVGSEEVLLSDTLTVANKLRAAKGRLRVSVYDGMFHEFQMALRLIPESREAWEEIGTFLEIIYGIRRKPDGKVVKRVKSGRRQQRKTDEDYCGGSGEN
ncbi:alpha/beta hydrolase [bacterium D16-54]|nr:alpha/beta hydrolase [bacterium D16-54]RKJ15548.1 alpha/beta hydrolase [bacterium D16-56]